MGKIVVLIIVQLLLLVSCQKEEIFVDKKLAIIEYMIADNSLNKDAVDDINEMEKSFYDNNYNGQVFVYVDFRYSDQFPTPVILKIKAGNTDKIESEVVKTYPEQNSCDPEVMKKVLKDIHDLSGNMYEITGLILWSHGLGWLPPDSYKSKNKSFGEDYNKDGSGYYKQMEISDLRKALSGYHFDYIVFDACLMCGIEPIYELRDLCDYVLASPSEMPSGGLPYGKVMNEFLSTNTDYIGIADQYFNDYPENTWPHCITVIRTKELENLSRFFKNEFCSKIHGVSIDDYSKEYRKSDIQQYYPDRGYTFFDLYDFVVKVTENKNSEVLFGKFKSIFDRIVIYERHRRGEWPALNNAYGLNCFIPNKTNARYENYYKTISWYKDAGLEQLFSEN